MLVLRVAWLGVRQDGGGVGRCVLLVFCLGDIFWGEMEGSGRCKLFLGGVKASIEALMQPISNAATNSSSWSIMGSLTMSNCLLLVNVCLAFIPTHVITILLFASINLFLDLSYRKE